MDRRRRRQDVAADEEAQMVSGKFTVVFGDLGREAIKDSKEIPQDHVC